MNSIFTGISEFQKNKLFKLLEAHIYDFYENEEILQTIKGKNIICIILEGSADMLEINYDGDENLIEKLEKESVFGTAISNMNDRDCQIRSTSPKTKIIVFDYNNVINLKNINHNYYNIFFNNLFDIIHKKLREVNDRIHIITKKTIRDKLLAYFEYEYHKTKSKFIYIPNNFKQLADFLAKKITLLYTP